MVEIVYYAAASLDGFIATPDGSVDWLPPVLGPNDWPAGIMADRSASWYFDRHQG